MGKIKWILGLSALVLASCGGGNSSSSSSAASSSDSSVSSSSQSSSAQSSQSSSSQASSAQSSASSASQSSASSSLGPTTYEALEIFIGNLAQSNQTNVISIDETFAAGIYGLGEAGAFLSMPTKDAQENPYIAYSGFAQFDGGYFRVQKDENGVRVGSMISPLLSLENPLSLFRTSVYNLSTVVTAASYEAYFELSEEDDMTFSVDGAIATFLLSITLPSQLIEAIGVTSTDLVLRDGGQAGTFHVNIDVSGTPRVYSVDVFDFGSTVFDEFDALIASGVRPAPAPTSWADTGIDVYLDDLWGEDRTLDLPFVAFTQGFQFNADYMSQGILGVLDIGLAGSGVVAYCSALMEAGWEFVEEESDYDQNEFFFRHLLDEETRLYATASLSLVTPSSGSATAILVPDGYFALALSTWVAPLVIEGFDASMTYVGEALLATGYPDLSAVWNVPGIAIANATLTDETDTVNEMYAGYYEVLGYYDIDLEIESAMDAASYCVQVGEALSGLGFEYDESFNGYTYDNCGIVIAPVMEEDEYTGHVRLTVIIEDFALLRNPDLINSFILEMRGTSGYALPLLPHADEDFGATFEFEDDTAECIEWGIDCLYDFYIYVNIADESDARSYIDVYVENFNDLIGWTVQVDDTYGTDYYITSPDGNVSIDIMASASSDGGSGMVYDGYYAIHIFIKYAYEPISIAQVNSLLSQAAGAKSMTLPSLSENFEVLALNMDDDHGTTTYSVLLSGESGQLNADLDDFAYGLTDCLTLESATDTTAFYVSEDGSLRVTIERRSDQLAEITFVFAPSLSDLNATIALYNTSHDLELPNWPMGFARGSVSVQSIDTDDGSLEFVLEYGLSDEMQGDTAMFFANLVNDAGFEQEEFTADTFIFANAGYRVTIHYMDENHVSVSITPIR